MASAPNALLVLSHSSDVVKPCIFRFILVGIGRVTGPDSHYGFFIICSSVILVCGLPGVVNAFNRFEPDMISPVIYSSTRETYEYVVAVFIIRCTKDIIVQN